MTTTRAEALRTLQAMRDYATALMVEHVRAERVPATADMTEQIEAFYAAEDRLRELRRLRVLITLQEHRCRQ